MKPAAEAWPETAAMVGIGREMRSATRDCSLEFMSSMRAFEAPAQARSKPLEKNLPWAVVIRAEEDADSARTRCRADWIASMSVGFSLCSSEPVIVRMKILPLFSNVHISDPSLSHTPTETKRHSCFCEFEL